MGELIEIISTQEGEEGDLKRKIKIGRLRDLEPKKRDKRVYSHCQ